MSDHNRPRILVLAHLPPPIHGVTVVNEAIVNSAFLRQHFRFDVLPMRFANHFSDIGSLRPGKFLIMGAIALRLAARLAFRRPDAVYMSLTPTGMSFVRDAMFVSIMNLFGVRKIFHLHGQGIQAALDRSLFNRLLYRWVFWKAHVIHLSRRLSVEIASLTPPERVHVIANGIAVPVTDVRRDPHAGPPKLLYLSNITRLKGIFVLLEALKLLCEEGVEFELHAAGAPADTTTQQTFLDMISAPPLQGRAEYAGIVTGDAKEQLFRKADIFVMPTLFDAFPLVALEAMAHTLPVICSEEGSLPDILRDGETGVLVRKNDPKALATALKSLILDPATRQQMGAAGRQRYATMFTFERLEANLAKTLERCVNADRG